MSRTCLHFPATELQCTFTATHFPSLIWLSWPGWLVKHPGGLPVLEMVPTPVVTGSAYSNFVAATNNYCTKPPLVDKYCQLLVPAVNTVLAVDTIAQMLFVWRNHFLLHSIRRDSKFRTTMQYPEKGSTCSLNCICLYSLSVS